MAPSLEFIIVTLVATFSLISCLPVPERERDHTGPVWNWVNGIRTSGRYNSRFLSPNGVETSEELSNVMEGMCNITGYISILKTINNTEASSLQGLLEQLLLEGCRLVKANDTCEGNSPISECTAGDLLKIQMACVSKQLASVLNVVASQATTNYSERVTELNSCDWLKFRVPGSETVQEALGC